MIEDIKNSVIVIGGGLAGCEASYQLLKRGIDVELYEMRPTQMTPCHKSDAIAELVCSNSLKSTIKTTSHGLLKDELELFDSLLLNIAKETRVPAGENLSVNRKDFSDKVYKKLKEYKNFKLIRKQVETINTNKTTIIATGPMSSDKIVKSISKLLKNGSDLYFYDAAAPIIDASSIDFNYAFFANRYNKGETKDYLNLTLNEEQYLQLHKNLISAKTVILKEFEKGDFFEACMPIEQIAKRGLESMRFGPLKPVGLYDENNKRHHAIIQLRKEDENGSMYNMVGFQTNLTYGEQKRVFSIIPALKNAEYHRYGLMHKNIYINSPSNLNEDFSLKGYENIYFAGQITGVEGYVESIASGLFTALNVYAKLKGYTNYKLPDTTMLSALFSHVLKGSLTDYKPMAANYGILKPLDYHERDKAKRKMLQYKISTSDIIKNTLKY